MTNTDLIRLERIDYTDQVLDAIKNWKRDPQLIDLEKYNKYKEIILSKIKDKKIPYSIQIDRITIETNSQGEKEEEFILSLEFDDMYLNFIEDVFFSTECSSLHYDSNSDGNELCEIWGERPLKLKELFYSKKKEKIEHEGQISKELDPSKRKEDHDAYFDFIKKERELMVKYPGSGEIVQAPLDPISKFTKTEMEARKKFYEKDNEFEKRFLYIERDLIRENKFSIAKSELGKIIHDAKIKNLSEVLDRARELLRFCNRKEHEFSKKIDETEKLIKEQLSKAKNLVHQKKALEAKEILEKVISQDKKIKEIVNSSEKKHSFSIIISQAEDLLDYCENFLQNKENLIKIEELIEDKKFLKANANLKDLIDEIKTYIGEREILHEEILNKALNLCEKLEKKKELKKKIPKIENLIQERKFPDAIVELKNIRNIARRYNLDEIISWIQKNLDICNKHTIKKTVLELGTKFTRLQIAEISEVCGIDDLQLIVDIVKDMIENKEIYAQYFSSTKSVAFDQQANIDEIDKLMSTYKEWEEKGVGKK